MNIAEIVAKLEEARSAPHIELLSSNQEEFRQEVVSLIQTTIKKGVDKLAEANLLVGSTEEETNTKRNTCLRRMIVSTALHEIVRAADERATTKEVLTLSMGLLLSISKHLYEVHLRYVPMNS